MTPVQIEPGLGVAVGYLLFGGIANEHAAIALDEPIAEAERSIRERFAARALAEDPVVAGIRALFRAGGIDPSRYRPSGEALARRVLRGDPLPRVNPLVDVNNLVSVTSLLPCGVYDRGAVGGTVAIRRGRDGESYEGIGKSIALAGRLASYDDDGPFGSPIADSRRTMATAETRAALALIYAPAAAERELRAALDRYRELAVRHLGADAEGEGVATG